MSVINYANPFIGNSSAFAPKENHIHITQREYMLQKVNSKNEMEKAACFGWLQFDYRMATIIIFFTQIWHM